MKESKKNKKESRQIIRETRRERKTEEEQAGWVRGRREVQGRKKKKDRLWTGKRKDKERYNKERGKQGNSRQEREQREIQDPPHCQLVIGHCLALEYVTHKTRLHVHQGITKYFSSSFSFTKNTTQETRWPTKREREREREREKKIEREKKKVSVLRRPTYGTKITKLYWNSAHTNRRV